MRALVKAGAGPGLRMAEVPEPAMGPAEVRIEVMRTGICGTDLHIEQWDAWAAGAITPPLVPGHEFYGRVLEVGELVTDVAVGDRVSAEGHVVCGMCRNCRAGRRHLCIRTSSVGVDRDGAFAEQVVVPGVNVWVHAHDLDPDLGAIFDPLGNAVHTALTFDLVGEDVLITGAGPVGLMATAVARHVGARFVVVTDVAPARLTLALRMGADLALDVRQAAVADAQRVLGMREGFDVGLEMSGQPTALQDMIANMTHGGCIALLGLPGRPVAVDWPKVVTHMLTVRGIYGREMFETWYAMAAMLASGLDIAPVVTDRFPAGEWQRGFDTARRAVGGKVVLDWTA